MGNEVNKNVIDVGTLFPSNAVSLLEHVGDYGEDDDPEQLGPIRRRQHLNKRYCKPIKYT